MVCPVKSTSFDAAFLVVEVNGITDSKSGRSAISHPELPTVASVILHHLFEVERTLSIRGDGRPLIKLPGSVGTCENVLQANCLLLALAFILCKSII
jgi:hypothetical protein